MDPTVVVGAEEVEDFASGDNDFLCLAAGEAAVDGADYAGGPLQGEAVEVHGGEKKMCKLGLGLRQKLQFSIYHSRREKHKGLSSQ